MWGQTFDPYTDLDGNLVLLSGGGGQFTRITRDGDTASMVYEDAALYNGVTTDGIWWQSDLAASITWNLTVEGDASAPDPGVISTPLPSSGLFASRTAGGGILGAAAVAEQRTHLISPIAVGSRTDPENS